MEFLCHDVSSARFGTRFAPSHASPIIDNRAGKLTDFRLYQCPVKAIYQSPTREAAETALLQLSDRWRDKYALAVHSWETNWESLATMFAYTPEIRRLIYTTNPIEGYNPLFADGLMSGV
jgi:hypothetical protein